MTVKVIDKKSSEVVSTFEWENIDINDLKIKNIIWDKYSANISEVTKSNCITLFDLEYDLIIA